MAQKYRGRYDAANVRRQQTSRNTGTKSGKSSKRRRSPALAVFIVFAAILVAAGVGTYAYCAPALNYDTI